MTEGRNNRITELRKDGESSIAPTFSKRGYNYGVNIANGFQKGYLTLSYYVAWQQ